MDNGLIKYYVIISLLLLAASVLLFANLGNQYLWQDEAETAVLARNTLEYGVPKAFDGRNTVNPRIGIHSHVGFGNNFTWLYHPWVQFYVTAFSFLLFGVNTFAARFPFAFFGLLNILMLYLLAYRLTKKKFIAVCSSFFLTFSVPYLLLMRQCRYYAPAVFFVLTAVLFYVKFREKGSLRDLIILSVSLILLGYTVHGVFIPIYAALALHYMLFSFDKKTFPKFFTAGLFIIGAVLPWFIYSRSSGHMAAIELEKIFKNLEFQVRITNKYFFPAVFFGIIYLIRAAWKRDFKIYLTEDEKQSIILILTVVTSCIFMFCFVEQRHLRYIVYFIPLLAILESMIMLRLAKYNRALLALFLIVSVATGVFNMGYPNFLFPKYLYEITHDYDGPVEGIVDFLDRNAQEGDVVKIIYGDIPLIFYTDLTIDNSWVYDDNHMPKWIVFRRGWHELLDNDYYSKVQKHYDKHVLDYPDIRYENRPGDLGYHKFATDKEAPGVIVFEKR